MFTNGLASALWSKESNTRIYSKEELSEFSPLYSSSHGMPKNIKEIEFFRLFAKVCPSIFETELSSGAMVSESGRPRDLVCTIEQSLRVPFETIFRIMVFNEQLCNSVLKNQDLNEYTKGIEELKMTIDNYNEVYDFPGTHVYDIINASYRVKFTPCMFSRTFTHPQLVDRICVSILNRTSKISELLKIVGSEEPITKLAGTGYYLDKNLYNQPEYKLLEFHNKNFLFRHVERCSNILYRVYRDRLESPLAKTFNYYNHFASYSSCMLPFLCVSMKDVHNSEWPERSLNYLTHLLNTQYFEDQKDGDDYNLIFRLWRCHFVPRLWSRLTDKLLFDGSVWEDYEFLRYARDEVVRRSINDNRHLVSRALSCVAHGYAIDPSFSYLMTITTDSTLGIKAGFEMAYIEAHKVLNADLTAIDAEIKKASDKDWWKVLPIEYFSKEKLKTDNLTSFLTSLPEAGPRLPYATPNKGRINNDSEDGKMPMDPEEVHESLQYSYFYFTVMEVFHMVRGLYIVEWKNIIPEHSNTLEAEILNPINRDTLGKRYFYPLDE